MKIEAKPNIDLRVTLSINEVEARALDALTGYGHDEFIKAFYQFLGQHYMAPHEAGLRSFLASIRDTLPVILANTDTARKAFLATGRTDG